MRIGIRGIDIDTLGQARLPYERLHQTLRIGDVIKAEPSLYTEAVLVGGTVSPLHKGDFIVVDLVSDLTTDTAVWAYRVYFALDLPAAMLGDGVDNRLWHQRASWARLHAFAAGDAGRKTHRIIKVEHGFRVDSPKRHADDVIDLHFAASPHAKPAIDAGVEIDCHGRVREVRLWNAVCRESRGFNALYLGPVPKLGHAIGRILARGLVGEQKLHDHAAGFDCSLRP